MVDNFHNSRMRPRPARRIDDIYDQVVQLVNSGISVKDAIRASGVSKGHFYKRRYIAELKLVDPVKFGMLYNGQSCQSQLNKICKDVLGEESLQTIIKELKRHKKLL